MERLRLRLQMGWTYRGFEDLGAFWIETEEAEEDKLQGFDLNAHHLSAGYRLVTAFRATLISDCSM